MTRSLHPLFQAIATAPTEQASRFRFMGGVSEYFGVQRWGIYLLDTKNNLASVDVKGVSDAFIEPYQTIGKSVDPVLQYVEQYHAPAHEELVLPRGAWKQCELYQRCCSEQDHEHIMTGPIVGRGQLIGTVHFARVGDTPAFNLHELANMGTVGTHLSACLAELRKPSLLTSDETLKRLTPREVRIATLVARGLTNAEIGAELWIGEAIAIWCWKLNGARSGKAWWIIMSTC